MGSKIPSYNMPKTLYSRKDILITTKYNITSKET